MQLTSDAFVQGGKIPQIHVMPGAGGKNISFDLKWSDPPPGVKSFALSVADPHPVARNWVHWLVIDIPSEVTSLPAGASGKRMPPGARELKNSFGDVGYGGPQPPRGTGDHPYVATLYALKLDKLELPVNATLTAFQQALEGKTLGSTTLTGYYGR